MPCIKVSSLNKRIIFEQKTNTTDGIGGFTSTWAKFATRWAKVTALRGVEKYRAERLESNVSHQIIVRYDITLVPTMRIIYEERVLTIKTIINMDESKKQYMEIMCEEEPA